MSVLISIIVMGVLIRTTDTLGPPNFVFILTDDQDMLLDGWKPMRRTLELVANNGITFENAFINTPLCCPSRSSILTGKYAHNLGVLNNSLSGNCSSSYWQDNFEKNSIASILKNTKNYTTFYAGKYLNQYGSANAKGVEHVPIGYDWWIGLKGNSKYYNYTLSINGTGKFMEDQYLTDVLVEYSLEFLRWNHKQPFFMMVAPPASHAPFTPAERHIDSFPNVKALRTTSFNYSSDGKHWIVTMPPKYLPSDVSRLDTIQRRRLQTLLAVDEMVEKIINELKRKNAYDNTYIIFTSDNGYHIGQFGQPWDKRQPYETDIRIPFFLSGPKIPKKQVISHPITSVDIAPTLLDLADVSIPDDMDGKSLKHHVSGNNYNEFILIEYWGEGNQASIDENCALRNDQLSECSRENWCKCQDSRNNTYSCIINLSKKSHLKLCQFYDSVDFMEVYDLTTDPFELHNIVKDLHEEDINFYLKRLRQVKNCRGKECRLLTSNKVY